MATWQQFENEDPGLAAAVKARFLAAKHHVLATVRSDGSPRVSGTEVTFRGADLLLGSMIGSVKAKDLRRNGRFALHSNPGDGSMEGGDAKVSGRAVEVTDPAEFAEAAAGEGVDFPFHLFRLDLHEAVLTTVDKDADLLVMRMWRPGRPPLRFERRNEDPVATRVEG